MARFKDFYELAKPERTLANVITAAAGFLLASPHHVDFGRLFLTLAGMALVIASACALNNFTDRKLDSEMARTNKRALVEGRVKAAPVLLFVGLLSAAGFLILGWFINSLVVALGLIAYIDYVIFYGWSKRHTIHSTLIGTVSGSMSIVAGYCAVTGKLNGAALLLFLIMFFWQMPHFYAIAIYRLNDYKAAKVPVWPVVKGITSTKRWIAIYLVGFLISVTLLKVLGYANYIYLVVALLIGLYWLWLAWQGFNARDNTKWARRVFIFSIQSIIPLMLVIAFSARLP